LLTYSVGNLSIFDLRLSPVKSPTERFTRLAGCRTLWFSGCGFRFNFTLARNDLQIVILKPSDEDG
jgi:hypothetical protein